MIGPCYIGLDDSDVSRHKGSLNPRLEGGCVLNVLFGIENRVTWNASGNCY